MLLKSVVLLLFVRGLSNLLRFVVLDFFCFSFFFCFVFLTLSFFLFVFLQLTVSTKPEGSEYPCPPFKLIILDEADSMTQVLI